MASADPFERAAKLEEKEELKRESMLRRIRRRGDSPIGALGFPWAIWALIRASYFEFGNPTIPQSIVRFFFNDHTLFTVLTVLVLLTIWGSIAGGGLRVGITRDDD